MDLKLRGNLSLLLALLVVIASVKGIFSPDFYSRETPNWQAQSIGQDIVNLFLVAPLLVISALFSQQKRGISLLLWAGTLLYLIYTFIIYCFEIHFNSLFIIYCFILGLSFYSFIYFLLEKSRDESAMQMNINLPVKVVGIYFLFVSIFFYFLWLTEIIPAIIYNTTPESLKDTGLFTNAVHVIDLSLFLPGLFIVGVLMLKGKQGGLFLAPVFLTFFILMDITIGFMVIMLNRNGIESNLYVAAGMAILTIISLTLLIWYLKSTMKIINIYS